MMYSEDIARKRFIIQAYSITANDEYKAMLNKFSEELFGYKTYEEAKNFGINVFEEPYTNHFIDFLKKEKPPLYAKTIQNIAGDKGFG